jgi:hypothetical protein
LVRFDRLLEAQQGCERQRQGEPMRFEGDEAVEQSLMRPWQAVPLKVASTASPTLNRFQHIA